MGAKKVIGIIWLVVLGLALSPIPLSFIDIVYHWLLLITIPVGAVLLIILGIIWLVLPSKKKVYELDSNLSKASEDIEEIIK